MKFAEATELIRLEDWLTDGLEHRIEIRRYAILRHTPCGAWIRDDRSKEKFILASGGRFAQHTLEGALESYRLRKKWQKIHGQRRIEAGQRGLDSVSLINNRPEGTTLESLIQTSSWGGEWLNGAPHLKLNLGGDL